MSDEARDPDEKCASCDHVRDDHNDRGTCKSCPCYGFFPKLARFCENPACDGAGCRSSRPNNGGTPR